MEHKYFQLNRMILLLIVFFVVSSFYLGFSYVKSSILQSKSNIKATYVKYSQAIVMQEFLSQGFAGCYFSTKENGESDFTGCEAFIEAIAEKFLYKKICEGNSRDEGCIPAYKVYSENPNCIGYSEIYMNNVDTSYVLHDDSTIVTFQNEMKETLPVFAIDVNGKEKPNQAGKDLFSFVIVKNKNDRYLIHPNITYCLPVGEDGYSYIHDL